MRGSRKLNSSERRGSDKEGSNAACFHLSAQSLLAGRTSWRAIGRKRSPPISRESLATKVLGRSDHEEPGFCELENEHTDPAMTARTPCNCRDI
eukprot:5450156-Alexandrium_andersonii.AAC.1